MAQIVLGMGSSHGPMLSTPASQWGQRVSADKTNCQHHFKGRMWTFDELVIVRKEENLKRQIGVNVWQQRYDACRAALSRLAEAFHHAKPDVAVIIGSLRKESINRKVAHALEHFPT